MAVGFYGPGQHRFRQIKLTN